MVDHKFAGRYSEILEEVITELSAVKVLREDFEDFYQGFVDVDVLLKDGKVFSYNYSYGSCSVCDEWESRELTDEEIKIIMKTESTIFDDIEQYNEWRKRC